MPYKPKRPCSHPRCSALIEVNTGGYCDEHKRKQQQEYDKDRGSAAKRGYGSRWQKARESFLAHHPLCVVCAGEGMTTLATVVDHIIPHKGDLHLFWDTSNWQQLCEYHHNQKTATEDGAFGNTSRR